MPLASPETGLRRWFANSDRLELKALRRATVGRAAAIPPHH
jgi:hypothetical protein